MDPNNYGNQQGNNWDETIYTGGYGGTGRSGNGLIQDAAGDNFGNDWGSPFPSGTPFVFCDGHTTTISYSYTYQQIVYNAENYLNTTPLSW
jgi:hypothetical protein